MKTDTDRVFVSVVIPVFNSETTLEPLVEELIRVMSSSYAIEVLLVNDASRDSSEKVCARLHEKYSGIVKVIFLARNSGEYNAVMAGLKHASGSYAVILDDDGQNPPSEVPVLMNEILSGKYDVVYGTPREKNHSAWRNAASRLHNLAACFVLRKPPSLYLSSFKAVNRLLLDALNRDDSSNPFPDAVILRTTKRVGQVFVNHEPRTSGKSGYSVQKLILLSLRMLPGRRLFCLNQPKPPFVIQKTLGF